MEAPQRLSIWPKTLTWPCFPTRHRQTPEPSGRVKYLVRFITLVFATTFTATATLFLAGAKDGIQHGGDDALAVFDFWLFQCQLVRLTVVNVFFTINDLNEAFVVTDNCPGELMGKVTVFRGGDD